MSCNSDYLNSTPEEIAYSQVLCILEEIKTGVHVDPKSDKWRGYHPKVYNKRFRSLSFSKKQLDKAVATACEKIFAFRPDELRNSSLELQTWWRDHQKADAVRLRLEEKKRRESIIRKKALAKLTKEECHVLGLDWEKKTFGKSEEETEDL